MKKIRSAIHPDDDLHYQKLGLTRNKIEIWELMYFGKAGTDKQ